MRSLIHSISTAMTPRFKLINYFRAIHTKNVPVVVAVSDIVSTLTHWCDVKDLYMLSI